MGIKQAVKKLASFFECGEDVFYPTLASKSILAWSGEIDQKGYTLNPTQFDFLTGRIATF